MKQKSAKDIAFEKERQKLNREIRNQQSVINALNQKIFEAEVQICQKDSEIERLNDWIQRLLAYAELDEKEMKSIIEKDKSIAKAAESVGLIFSAFKRFY